MIKNRGLGKFLLLLMALFAVLPFPVLGVPFFLKPEGDLLYVAHEEGIIETRDKYSGSLEGRFQKDIDLWMFEKDGTNFYIGSPDGRLLVLNPDGEVLEEINVSGSPISSLTIDKEHSRLYTGSWDNKIRVWDMRDWSLEKVIDKHKLPVNSLVLDGPYLYSGGGDGFVKVWDRQTLAFVKNLTTHTDWQTARNEGYPIRKIIVEGDKLYAGHYNGNIRIWDLTTNSLVKEIKAHSEEVRGLVTDGQRVYSIGDFREGNVKIWTMEGEPTGVVLTTGKSPTALAVDENHLYVGVYEGGILVYSKDFWNLEREIGTFAQKPPEEQQLESLETSGLNPLLPVIVIFALFLVVVVMLETYVNVKKKQEKLTIRGIGNYLTTFVTIEDVLKILIIGSIIIFVIGMVNTASVFPSYMPGLQAIYYFDMLVKRGAFLPVWFLSFPSVAYWMTKKHKRKVRYSASVIALLVAVIIYLFAPTVV